MRFLVVGSCGKKKRRQCSESPTCTQLTTKDSLKTWQRLLHEFLVPAREMYIGNQSRELVHAVDLLRGIEGLETHLYIISAGFGIIHENERIPPYDCTFSNLGKKRISQRAEALSISSDFKQLCGNNYDLVYLALGKKYLVALGDAWKSRVKGTVIMFSESSQLDRYIAIPSGAPFVKQLSARGFKIHGIAGLKGDFLRILTSYALKQTEPLSEIMKWTNPSHFSKLIPKLS